MELITTYLRTSEKRFIDPILSDFLNELSHHANPVILERVNATPPVGAYALTYRPVAGTVRIESRGHMLRDGYEYHVRDKHIVLNQIPQEGEFFKVTYTVGELDGAYCSL